MNVLLGISYIVWSDRHQTILLPDLNSVGKPNNIEVVLRPKVLKDGEEGIFGLEEK